MMEFKNFNDVMGRAMERFQESGEDVLLQLTIDGEREPDMPASVFFRMMEGMNTLELEALKQARGKVLDVGAGAGCHALELQRRGFEVTALERSPAAARVMKERGVKQVICSPVMDFRQGPFETILLLMNGFGIAGNESGLERLLVHLKSILHPKGRIIADSVNLSDWKNPAGEDLSKGYFGEVKFNVSDGHIVDEFDWIYPDEFLLDAMCDEVGLRFNVLSYGESGAFLCEIAHAG